MKTTISGTIGPFEFSFWAAALMLLAQGMAVEAQFNFTTNDGAITITGYTGPAGDVTIPSSINSYPVTSIGDSSFPVLSLTSVTIPNSVTNIGVYAFRFCSGLTSISVDVANPSYASTGGVLFDKPLTTLIQYPQAKIGSYAIPNSVTTIHESAFFESGVTTVTIPNSVTTIGDNAFFWCAYLRSVAIGASATNFGGGAFELCSSLTNIAVDVANPSYASADGVLFNKALTTLVLYPEGLTGSYAIPNSVTNIGNGAFYRSALTSVTLGNSVTSIGAGAFDFCSSLTSFAVDAANPSFASSGGVLFDKTLTTLVVCPQGLAGSYSIPNGVTTIGNDAFLRSGLRGVTIPNSVAIIGSNAFEYSFNLASVTIPNSVTTIGGYAFSDSLLKTVTIGNSVTIIGEHAFDHCYNLTNVIIPNSVTTIGGGAFSSCYGLTNVTIGNSVATIGDYAFFYCRGLTNIAVDFDNPTFASAGGVLFNKTLTTLVLYPAGFTGDYAIPNTVTAIGDNAFYYCPGLTSVTIPNTVTVIGDHTFRDCSGLSSVTIPNSVTNLGQYAFDSCFALTNAFFQGNAPDVNGGAGSADSSVFSGETGTAYYVAGTTGWGSTFGGWPTVELSTPSPPQVRGSVGIHSGNFGFTITGASNQTVVVEASTNLVNWQPVWIKALNGTNVTFTDSQWTNYPKRFYRMW